MSEQLKLWSAMARSKVNNDYDVPRTQTSPGAYNSLMHTTVVEAMALFVQQHEIFTL